ncbi:MAG: hypothetical protein WCO57_15470 [Verrucomicrobiota bacterium]
MNSATYYPYNFGVGAETIYELPRILCFGVATAGGGGWDRGRQRESR